MPHKEGICPKCGSILEKDLEGCEFLQSGARDRVTCSEPECGFDGWEYYSWVFDGFYDLSMNEVKDEPEIEIE